jgi:hypothetical protein
MELSMRGADGQYRPFLTRVVPLRHQSGSVSGWIGTHIDISESKRHEQELADARDAAEEALRSLREAQNSLIESEKLAALGRLVGGRRARDQQSGRCRADRRFDAGAPQRGVRRRGRARRHQAVEPQRVRCRHP